MNETRCVMFRLRCVSCVVECPVCATSARELLNPDFNDMDGQSERLIDQLRAFRDKHAGHFLQAVPVEIRAGVEMFG